jgi:hypothetical protein
MDNENIGYLLHRVGFALDRHSDQVLRERLGIGFSQFKILLAKLKPASAGRSAL